jgi:hypothetical protein
MALAASGHLSYDPVYFVSLLFPLSMSPCWSVRKNSLPGCELAVAAQILGCKLNDTFRTQIVQSNMFLFYLLLAL